MRFVVASYPTRRLKVIFKCKTAADIRVVKYNLENHEVKWQRIRETPRTPTFYKVGIKNYFHRDKKGTLWMVHVHSESSTPNWYMRTTTEER